MNFCPTLLAVCTDFIFHREAKRSPPLVWICEFQERETHNLEDAKSIMKGIPNSPDSAFFSMSK